jgi:hypothetical protein
LIGGCSKATKEKEDSKIKEFNNKKGGKKKNRTEKKVRDEKKKKIITTIKTIFINKILP